MEDLSREEEGNRRKGFIFSTAFHILVIILAAIFGFSYQDPPPEPPGVTVALGIPDVGQGDDPAPQGDPAPPVEETEPEPVPEKPEPVKPEVTKPTPDPPKKVTEDPEAAAIKKQKEEQKKKQQEEAKQKAAEEAKKRAEEARKKAEADAEAKRQAELGAAVGDALKKGKGQGNTGKPGNQGDPSGDPDGKALEGLGGNGDFGGGLGKRNIVGRPAKLQHATQVTCVVYVNVCADASGSVTSTEIVYSKSSCTEDSALLNKVKANAKGFRFNKSSSSKQCGEIAYKIN